MLFYERMTHNYIKLVIDLSLNFSFFDFVKNTCFSVYCTRSKLYLSTTLLVTIFTYKLNKQSINLTEILTKFSGVYKIKKQFKNITSHKSFTQQHYHYHIAIANTPGGYMNKPIGFGISESETDSSLTQDRNLVFENEHRLNGERKRPTFYQN